MDAKNNGLAGKNKRFREKDFIDLVRRLAYKNKQIDTLWRSTFLYLRIIWAFVPLFILVFMGIFTWWLTSGIGSGKLNFHGYETFLNIIAGDIILNVLGLVFIIMKFLFPNSDYKKNKENEDNLFALPSSHES
jgi:hypothetical protein